MPVSAWSGGELARCTYKKEEHLIAGKRRKQFPGLWVSKVVRECSFVVLSRKFSCAWMVCIHRVREQGAQACFRWQGTQKSTSFEEDDETLITMSHCMNCDLAENTFDRFSI